MNIFFVSKPIQYHNARQLSKSLDCKNNILVIFGNFYGAYQFYKNVKEHDREWSKVVYSTSRVKSYLKIILSSFNRNIYIDSDYGKDAPLVYIMSLLSRKIALYEEGQFSYYDSLKKHYIGTSPFKTKVYELLGLPLSLGSSSSVREYYVYDLNEFTFRRKEIKNKGRLIKKGFYVDTEDVTVYTKVFDVDLSIFGEVNDLFFYIGPKSQNEFISSKDLSEYTEGNHCFFKPHPGSSVTIESTLESYQNITYYDNLIPIELLISMLEKKQRTTTVLHHKSTVGKYLSGTSVKILDINNDK